jgi:hypothetical protein
VAFDDIGPREKAVVGLYVILGEIIAELLVFIICYGNCHFLQKGLLLGCTVCGVDDSAQCVQLDVHVFEGVHANA